MREYEIKNTSIKKTLKAVQLIKKFSIFALWRSQFEAKNTGNSMQVKGSCSVVLILKT